MFVLKRARFSIHFHCSVSIAAFLRSWRVSMNSLRVLILVLAQITLSAAPQHATAQVMIGAYVPGDAWDVSEISAFNQSSKKDLAFVTVFSAFSHNWNNHLQWQASNIFNNGAVPLISWMPVDIERRDDNLLPEIIAGDWDSYIDDWISGMLSWIESYPSHKKPITLLRFAHEFNGSWYPYAGEPDQYVKAWRHIHKLFAERRANDYVEWVWSANNIDFDEHNDMTLYYPGDNHVDWTSLDGYNWGSNHDWTSWDSFQDLFATAYHLLVNNYPDKPILIAEYGTAEPADTPSFEWGQFGDDSDKHENRDQWFLNTLSVIEQEFPAIRGLGLFNMNKELSWSLTKSASTGIDAFNAGIGSNHYTENFLGARLMVLGAAIDAETLWRLENEHEENYDAVVDGSFLPGDEPASLKTGARAYYSTDRLRTNVVVRNVIDMTTHQLNLQKKSPDAQTLLKAGETVRRYKARFKQQQGPGRGFRRQSMELINY